MDKNFIDINLNLYNQDIYLIRKSIHKALKNSLPLFNGDLLDIGCGKMPYRDYILKNSAVEKYVGLDIANALVYDTSIKPDFTWDGIKMPFEDNIFDSAFGTEVLEHCPDPEIILKETYRVLKIGGVFFFTVPFIWNLHEVPYDEYRFTPFSIKRHLESSGFKDIELYPTGGWHYSLAQIIGLWVCRAPMSKYKRKLLQRLTILAVKFLIHKGDQEQILFREGQMITGLYGTAKKY